MASSIQGLCLRSISGAVVVIDPVALGGLQRLDIENCKIYQQIWVGWENKEKGELLRTKVGFKNLSTVSITHLEGPKDLTWLLSAKNLRFLTVRHSSSIEKLVNSKGATIARLKKLESLEVTNMYVLKTPLNPLDFPNLRRYVVKHVGNLPLSFRE